MITLIDFGGRGRHRFSPYVWRTKLALAHLGLTYETRDITFLDKSALRQITDHDLAPVIIDNGQVVTDSWDIALFLNDHYPSEPALFSDAGQIRFAAFLNTWVPQCLYPVCLPMIAVDVVTKVLPDEQEHYRTTREARLGCSLEDAAGNRTELSREFEERLEPLRTVLSEARYLNGSTPGYSDYIVGALFLWMRGTSPFQPLRAEDPVLVWRRRLFDRYRDIIIATDGYDW